MARIDFDHQTAGGPVISYGIDFDKLTPKEIADRLGLDATTGARYAALCTQMAGVAHDQATLNKLVASAMQTAIAAVKSGAPLAAVFPL